MSDIEPKNLIRIAHENGDGAVAQPLDLGVRVRELRKARDWTLEQAAVSYTHLTLPTKA